MESPEPVVPAAAPAKHVLTPLVEAVAGGITAIIGLVVFLVSLSVSAVACGIIFVAAVGALAFCAVVLAVVAAWEALSMWLNAVRDRRREKKRLKRLKAQRAVSDIGERLWDSRERDIYTKLSPSNETLKP